LRLARELDGALDIPDAQRLGGDVEALVRLVAVGLHALA
jgi:hypothetical protein